MIDHKGFLSKCKQAAMNLGLSWPGYIAAQAALESRYGTSQLAVQAANLFGTKAHKGTPSENTLSLPTKEWVTDHFEPTIAVWMKYQDWEACLRDRQATLVRLAPQYPHYQAALDAGDGETYIRELAHTWATDPHYADKVLEVYNENADVLA